MSLSTIHKDIHNNTFKKIKKIYVKKTAVYTMAMLTILPLTFRLC